MPKSLLDFINDAENGRAVPMFDDDQVKRMMAGQWVGLAGDNGVMAAWFGKWNPAVMYLAGDGVGYRGSAWLAVNPNQNSQPSDVSADWDLVAAGGAAGGAAWGDITGTLANQTDLFDAINEVYGVIATEVGIIEGQLDGKQDLNAQLTTLEGLVPGVGVFIGSNGGGWEARTASLARGDLSINNVDNTSDANKPVSSATQTALNAKQPLDSDLTTIAGLTPTTDNFMVAAASAWASRTPAQAKTSLALVKADVGLGSVDNTSDAGKPVSTAQQTALDLKANLASPTFSGTPSLPTGTTGTTQAAADSSTKLATTAFATTADNLKANLASPTFTGTVTMPGPTINDATDITISTTTGTKIGQAASKIGFYGITPAVRPTTLTQTYSTTSATHAAITSSAMPAGGVGIAAGGWSSAVNRDAAIAAFAADRTDLANLKNFVNQIVDQLQALGILQ